MMSLDDSQKSRIWDESAVTRNVLEKGNKELPTWQFQFRVDFSAGTPSPPLHTPRPLI